MKMGMGRPRTAIGRWREGRRIHGLCDRFRARINDPNYEEMSDQAVLLSFYDLVTERPESRGRSDEEIVAATVTALELAVLTMEDATTSRATDSDGR